MGHFQVTQVLANQVGIWIDEPDSPGIAGSVQGFQELHARSAGAVDQHEFVAA